MLPDEQLVEREEPKDHGVNQRNHRALRAIQDSIPIHGDSYSLTRIPEIQGSRRETNARKRVRQVWGERRPEGVITAET